MNLSDIVSISLSITNPPNLQTGFSTGLITGFSNRMGSNVIRYYANLSAVANDFLIGDPEYLAAVAYFAQLPTPTNLAIGKRTAEVAQVSTLTVNTYTNGHVYTLSVFGQTVTFTAGGGDTTTTIATALATAIAALTPPLYQNLTVTHPTNTVVMTANNAGVPFSVSNADTLMTLVATTPSNGIQDDLLKITQAQNGNNWVLFSQTGESIQDIWEGNIFSLANQKIQIAKSNDANVLTSTSSTLYAALFAAQGGGTLMNYFSLGLSQYGDAAVMGNVVTQNPGSYSPNLKTLVGITNDATLTESQITNLKAYNVNFYTSVGVQPFYINGKMPDGNGIDIYYGLYAFEALTQIALVTAMAALPKFPFDADGLTIINDVLNAKGDLFAGPLYNFFSPDPVTGKSYTVTLPLLSSFTAAQRKAGNLTGVVFQGHLAGDALTASITGTVNY